MKIATNLLRVSTAALLVSCSSEQKVTPRDWDEYPMPVASPEGKAWVLSDQSDDFNYQAGANDKGEEFYLRWKDSYIGNWSGPAPTIWQSDHVTVDGGYLQIDASRPEDAPMREVVSGESKLTMPATYTGCISSVQEFGYPLFVEARVKVANSMLASNVWMLSGDSTQEIDIVEAYGGSRGEERYFEYRMHLSHHVFIRQPFQDYQPQDGGTWHVDNPPTLWRDSFRRVGVYWRDPFHLEYYIDGELVRTVSGEEIIDPRGYTEGRGLNKNLKLIINREDQSWRAVRDLSPTAEELADHQGGIYLVDWVRIYNLVDAQ